MKRFLTGALAALLSAVAFGATLNPVQLLNPAGSTSGQAIISTGASTAPAWGNVTAAKLAAQAANTVVANVTASSASPTAFPIPSCSTSSSALGYTSGSGITCNTSINAATLGSATFAAPGAIGSTTPGTGAFTTLAASGTVSGAGFSTYLASPPAIGTTAAATGKFTTLQATSTITPSSTAGIVGTAANDNAQSGSVGEYVSSTNSGGSAMTSGTALNITSISLTAGDWDVSGVCEFSAAASTAYSVVACAPNTTTASLGSYVNGLTYINVALTTATNNYIPAGTFRVSVAATTTVFLVGQANFTTSTMTAFGFIWARRRR